MHFFKFVTRCPNLMQLNVRPGHGSPSATNVVVLVVVVFVVVVSTKVFHFTTDCLQTSHTNR